MKKTYAFLLILLIPFTVPKVMAQTDKSNNTKILILIHSDTGGTYELAKELAKGIESESYAKAVIKQVKPSANSKLKDIPAATVDELPSYDGIVFGSPVYFGNISTPMSEFLSKTVDLWTNHALEGMPAAVFMSAGSGAGRELALQSFWNSLAVHGMVLVSNGIRGSEKIDKNIPLGNSVLGSGSLASLKTVQRPAESERTIALLQGKNFAKVAQALKGSFKTQTAMIKKEDKTDIDAVLKQKNIELPKVPAPAGNYVPYVRSGNLVFINQVSFKDGVIVNPGKLGKDVNEDQVKEASKITMLNVISVLKEAVDGDLNRVKKCVQLTGIFNTPEGYTKHADLMNAASNLTVEIFGEKGKHTRGTLGASSLPVNSSVEIQAIFEVE
ncbi:Atu1372/SO_1960 family protein [Flavobacterium gelatinilyticum]|uniref:Atu1372/SO_1960 family protein n=1 Tax=Flavobacterium gelatinilyticum TaxID=3003260 RepID=UPI00247FE2E8|nr:Atu1372/SO_1960 family protein [Flavobacterium gelatinilyticum]